MAGEPPLLPNAEEARRWAAEELAKSEYREAEPGWLDSLWQNFLDWLAALDGSAAAPDPVPGPVIGIVIAVVIAIAVILARPRLNARARRRGNEVFEPDSALTAVDYRHRADAAASAGKWEDAVVDRFRALVRSAEDRTILEPQPGRTADEVVLALTVPFPAEVQRLHRAGSTFDAIRYGNATAGKADYQSMAGLDDGLEATRPVKPPSTQQPVLP